MRGGMRWWALGIFAAASSFNAIGTAHAISFKDEQDQMKAIREQANTDRENAASQAEESAINQKEREDLDKVHQEFKNEHPHHNFGNERIPGRSGIASINDSTSQLPGGFATTLDFQIVDPITLAQVNVDIGSVQYFINTDPTLSDANFWTLLGTSTDVANNFSFALTLPSVDAEFEAVPYDSNGAAIIYVDPVDGVSNDALALADNIPVPEPASLALIGTALIGLGAARRRKRNPA